ncbi:MAG: M48 family metallopeptidase [Planctomycetaceae bacterium]|nr:M48 family metallopeptidase [Planctomycetaceae bacterium]
MSKTCFYTMSSLSCLFFVVTVVIGCSQNQVAENRQPTDQKTITQTTQKNDSEKNNPKTNNSETNGSESIGQNIVTDLFDIGMTAFDKASRAENPADLVDVAADGLDSAARSALKTADEILPAELEDEIKFGKMFNDEIIKNSKAHKIDKKDKKNKRLYSIWHKLHPKRTDIKYRLFVIEKDTINAFAHAGGYVYIYTGLIEKCNNNDDALAFVLAHEISHIDLKHVNTGLGRLKAMEMIPGSELINAVVNKLSPSYNKTMEFEADAAGWQLGLDAGYQPNKMIELFDILPDENKITEKNKSENSTTDIANQAERIMYRLEHHFDTHPQSSERKKKLLKK